MNAESLHRIRRSFDLLEPRIARLTELFYRRVFEVIPESRAMFKVDMEIQRQHMAAALALIVRNLSMLDTIREALRDLGASHARVGVRAEQYPLVRDAMLLALNCVLEDAWSHELSADWRALLDYVATEMQAGANG